MKIEYNREHDFYLIILDVPCLGQLEVTITQRQLNGAKGITCEESPVKTVLPSNVIGDIVI